MPVYTLKPGHARTFLMGAARRPGEAVTVASPGDLGPADREALEAHFDRTGGTDGPQQVRAAPPALLRNGLTEDQARQKLKGAGAAFAENMRGAALADLFDTVFSAPGATPAAATAPAAAHAGSAPAAPAAESAAHAGDAGDAAGGADAPSGGDEPPQQGKGKKK